MYDLDKMTRLMREIKNLPQSKLDKILLNAGMDQNEFSDLVSEATTEINHDDKYQSMRDFICYDFSTYNVEDRHALIAEIFEMNPDDMTVKFLNEDCFRYLTPKLKAIKLRVKK